MKGTKWLIFIFAFASCGTLVHKTGEFIEGSAAGKTTLGIYRSAAKDKNKSIELKEISRDDGKWITEFSSTGWPGLTLCGGMQSGSGNFELFGARILSSHVHGWNEFVLDIMGTAFFDNPKRSGGLLRVNGKVERVQISSGKIRLKSDHLTGDRALAALRNRRERILALTEWMAEKAESGAEKTIFTTQKEFERYWKPKLFPEQVSNSKRPPEYARKNAEWRRADSVKWNLSYTENSFPEGLWEYRNSGAMLRDWEEALPWIFMEYSWDYILSSFNDTLSRIK